MALLRTQNKLIYPGGNPGIDMNRIKGPYLAGSAVAGPGGNFIDCATGVPATLTSPGGTTTVLDPIIGPAVKFTAGTSTFPNIPMRVPSGFLTPARTLAAICRMPSSTPTANAYLIGTFKNNAGGFNIVVGSNGSYGVFDTALGQTNFMTAPLGAPCFVAVSVTLTSCNWILRNLNTGATFFGTSTVANVSTTTDPNTVVQYGNRTDQLRPWGNGSIAAAATIHCLSSTGGLTLAQLQAWAEDPWSFWYPPSIGFEDSIAFPIQPDVLMAQILL